MAQHRRESETTLAGRRYLMPAEWERHAATWLGWPHLASDWPGKMQAIRWAYGELIRKLSAGERIRLCVNSKRDEHVARTLITQAGGDPTKVDVLAFPTNRGWMRDSGPLFVRRANPKSKIENPKSRTAIVHFHFNAWAKYPNWRKDRVIPELAAKRFGYRLIHARLNGRDIILEGGGIDVNGRGTLLTTEECYLDPKTQVRNPGLGRREFEQVVRDFLGATHVLWLGRGIVGDDTHGHVDDICRFVNPATVVLVQERNPKDVNYRPLAENRERLEGVRLEDGSKLQVVALPMPAPLFFGDYRLPASYANFYLCNAAVLVPTFNDPNDRIALGILAELFPDRPVVGLHAVDLVLGFGTLHCLTQQEPA